MDQSDAGSMGIFSRWTNHVLQRRWTEKRHRRSCAYQCRSPSAPKSATSTAGERHVDISGVRHGVVST
eukprot:786180-Pyramimonas_sp.AAC.1